MMSVQNPYNLLNRSYEVGLAEISVREKSGLLAYSPLAFGYLTGKYRNNNFPEKSRLKLFKDFTRYENNNGQKAIEEYYKISKKFDINFTQMSLLELTLQLSSYKYFIQLQRASWIRLTHVCDGRAHGQWSNWISILILK